MSKKAYETLTETMFYVLMSINKKNMCGMEIVDHVKHLTKGRIVIAPGTLYPLLSNLQRDGIIKKADVQGRKIHYLITDEGKMVYKNEINRLKACLLDAENDGLV